jgi:hypothetical protein
MGGEGGEGGGGYLVKIGLHLTEAGHDVGMEADRLQAAHRDHR